MLKCLPIKSKLFTLFLLSSLSAPALANFNYWGSGMWGGQQGCGYGYEVSDESAAIQDEIDELKEQMSGEDGLRSELREIKSKIKTLEGKVERAEKKISETIGTEKASFITEHITHNSKCEPNRTGWDAIRGPAQKDWANYCEYIEGGSTGRIIETTLCSQEALPDKNTASKKSRCVDGVKEFRENKRKLEEAQAKQEAIEDKIEAIKDQIADLKGDKRDADREARAEAREEGTEASFCPWCGSGGRRKTSTLDTVAGVGLGLLGMYAGYRAHKNSINVNAELGFPTNPAQGFGYPFMAAAGALSLYGAVSGGMNGAFGCGGGMGGMYGPGGMYGYPGGMYGGYPGGGMWMPGMGMMGGMNGMLGLGGGMNGGFPGLMGMPGMGGYPGMGGGFNLGGGLGAGLGMGGFPGMGGYPGIGGGFNLGGGFPGMGGYPGMGGFPGMGGYPGLGGGFNLGGGLGAGLGMGGFPGLGGGLGAGLGLGGGLDGGLGSIQMQQQMAQMQMQQYQIWMEQQQKMQENAMARQRVVSGLQMELYNLVNRIQQAQYGLGVDSSIGLPSTGGGFNNPGVGVGDPRGNPVTGSPR